MAVFSLNEIANSAVIRCSTGIPDLDEIFGKTTIDGITQFGLPMGYITYLSGAPGVGKTRVAIKIAKNINNQGMRVLVFQGEVRPSEFKQWTGTNTGTDVAYPSRFFVSDDRDLKSICRNIENNEPYFVIIDSANMIDGFGGQDDCRIIFETLKEVVANVGCHLLMIGHLTKTGITKGSADVEHLVDVVCKLKHFPEAEFLKVYDKNQKSQIIEIMGQSIIWEVMKSRYGPAGGWVTFKHTDTGVDFFCSSIMLNQTICDMQQQSQVVNVPQQTTRSGNPLSWFFR